jgi:hypothetical protein
LVNFLVAGDIGAASNLIRNIMLLSNDIHWPLEQSRLTTILNQYPERLTVNKLEWIFIEVKLRFFDRYYGIDPSHDLNWANYEKNLIATEQPAVFINHSFVWELDNFFTFAKHMPSIIVMPTTDLGLEWQIRAYCEKKGVDIMHNFTFLDRIEEQKAKYIDQHGVEAWHRENIANMKMIIRERRDHIMNTVNLNTIVPLEWVLSGNDDQLIVDKLSHYFDININLDQALTVLNTYRSRHWPLEDTHNWKYA